MSSETLRAGLDEAGVSNNFISSCGMKTQWHTFKTMTDEWTAIKRSAFCVVDYGIFYPGQEGSISMFLPARQARTGTLARFPMLSFFGSGYGSPRFRPTDHISNPCPCNKVWFPDAIQMINQMINSFCRSGRADDLAHRRSILLNCDSTPPSRAQ